MCCPPALPYRSFALRVVDMYLRRLFLRRGKVPRSLRTNRLAVSVWRRLEEHENKLKKLQLAVVAVLVIWWIQIQWSRKMLGPGLRGEMALLWDRDKTTSKCRWQ